MGHGSLRQPIFQGGKDDDFTGHRLLPPSSPSLFGQAAMTLPAPLPPPSAYMVGVGEVSFTYSCPLPNPTLGAGLVQPMIGDRNDVFV